MTDDDDDFEFYIEDLENKKFYVCQIWQDTDLIHAMRIFSSSVANAAQSAVEHVFEMKSGDWSGGHLKITDDVSGETTRLSVTINSVVTESGDVEADVQIEEI